jgi:predicted HicB family RNase H-like nuclease
MDQQSADEGGPLNGTTRLVSTRLPNDLHRAVELAAARELISVASFARRAIAQAVRGLSTKEAARG